MIKAVLTSFLMLSGAPVAARQVVPCDWAARADAIVEPWATHTKTFANGNVRLARLDTLAASYDPAFRPSVDFDVQLFGATQGDFHAARLLVVVDQTAGGVTTQLADFDI